MELIELKAITREGKGKGDARKLRAQKLIPAIVYGAKVDPQQLSVSVPDFDKIIRDNGTTGLFFDLKVEGQGDKMVMLKEIQMDPLGLNYLHIDFLEIDMDAKVSVMIPVEAEGASVGVKDGGMLQIIRRELEILCKPKDTPEAIVLDISKLDIGDSIHVADIDLGESIEIPHEVNFTVLTIVPPDASSDVAEEGGDDEEASA